jgi:hypothetical protein
MAFSPQFHGSACGPVIVPVFKTGGRQAILSPVGSTPTRFRHFSRSSFLDRLRSADLHVSLCQGEQNSPEARFGGARTANFGRTRSSHVCLSAMVSAFAEPDIHSLSQILCGSSPKIECVFSAGPETIRREPREFDVRRSVGNCRTWQSARCVISVVCRPEVCVSKPPPPIAFAVDGKENMWQSVRAVPYSPSRFRDSDVLVNHAENFVVEDLGII